MRYTKPINKCILNINEVNGKMEQITTPNMRLIGAILVQHNIDYDIDDWVYLTHQMELKHGQSLKELPTKVLANSLLKLIK